jgi:hypothetical protein
METKCSGTFLLKEAMKALRRSRSIALLFLELRHQMGLWSTPQPGRFAPEKKTLYMLHSRMGGPRTGLDGCGKSRLYRDSIPEPSSQRSTPLRNASSFVLKNVFICNTFCVTPHVIKVLISWSRQRPFFYA